MCINTQRGPLISNLASRLWSVLEGWWSEMRRINAVEVVRDMDRSHRQGSFKPETFFVSWSSREIKIIFWVPASYLFNCWEFSSKAPLVYFTRTRLVWFCLSEVVWGSLRKWLIVLGRSEGHVLCAKKVRLFPNQDMNLKIIEVRLLSLAASAVYRQKCGRLTDRSGADWHTDLPQVPNNTPVKSEMDQMDICWNMWRTLTHIFLYIMLTDR